MFNTAEGLRDIYSLSAAPKFLKSQGYAPMVHRAPNTLTIRGGKDHARRRRIMAQGVSEKAQRGYEHRIANHINKFCDLAFTDPKTDGSDNWSEPKNMAKWCK